MPLLLAGFLIGLPVLDIVSLIEVGDRIGLWPTLGLVVAAFVAGSALMRSQGFTILKQAQITLEDGRFPAREVFDGACVLVGGMLLLFPGFASDLIGIALLIPAVRSQLRRVLGAQIQRSGRFAVWTVGDGTSATPGAEERGPVIDGEYRTVEDESPSSDRPINTPDPHGNGTPVKPPSSPWTHHASTAVVPTDKP